MNQNLFLAVTGQLSKLLDTLKKYLPDLPIKDNPRNLNLRAGILGSVIAQVLTDDERATFFGLPEGCRIREGAKIISPEKLKIGKYCWIGENAMLDASGGLEIGSHNSIGLSVFIWSHSSHLTNLGMQNEMSSALIQRKATKIGNGCFISGPSVITAGVTIGDNVFIKPFSTVSQDIPSGSLVEGGSYKRDVFTEERIKRMIQKQMDSME
jgi:acetyltransferase-like isoleucine patch superfamily enzyme